MNQPNYNTALYMRLSRDDEGYGDSIRIETQRTILRKFAQDNQLRIYDEYIDDGLANSGSFLKRSEFVFVVLLTPFSAWDMKNIQGGFRLWLTNEKIRHFRPLFLH